MSSGARVAVKLDTGITVHCAAGYGDFDTLCGIDSNDPNIGHFGVVSVAANAKIDCPACRGIFRAAKQYRELDFK
jgi:hypothetical protein